jgi:hypothetical protein
VAAGSLSMQQLMRVEGATLLLQQPLCEPHQKVKSRKTMNYFMKRFEIMICLLPA